MNKLLILPMLFAMVTLFSACAVTGTATSSKTPPAHLSDGSGMTLYTFDKDQKNKSNCYNVCESKWPIFYGEVSNLKLPSGVESSDFGTITRDNGVKQTTYKSMPLYYFFKDSAPKEKKGDGVKGVWHIIK